MAEHEPLLTTALEYASLGFKVFPLSPLSKIPLKNTKGFKEATTDQETIFNWFIENEQSNIGISMVDSSIFAIDVDNHAGNNQGLESLKKLCNGVPLPDDLTIVETANGGYHIYVKAPAGVEIKQQIGFRPSIDIIKNFVVAPESIIKRKDGSIGTYKIENGSLDDIKEVPPAILEALMNKEQQTQQGSTHKADYSNGKKKYTAQFLEKVIQGVDSGGRNNWLKDIVGTPLAQNMDVNLAYEFIHIVNQSCVRPPLNDDEVNKIFKSILNRERKKRGG
ncbi:MAG: hypothetical protein PWR19_2155 [Carnobacterium sp.]|uniref:bifunctional DNA primase/polymerase n=1 Tax=Carnobacterium sp. TaxID=48221 RepID=UPI0026487831|nr:bifunctional DNA primase/polymerase [Carnobacterium sp.]MDN5373109.1 hypothetical protein [Carnobacterium sp.]